MSLVEILEEVGKLSREEKQVVLSSLTAAANTDMLPSAEVRQNRVLTAMVEKGMLKKMPADHNLKRISRPVSIEGKSLSETIIEERR